MMAIQKIKKDDIDGKFLTYHVKKILLPVSGKQGFVAVPFGHILNIDEATNLYLAMGDFLILNGENTEFQNYNVTSVQLNDSNKIFLGVDETLQSMPEEKDMTAIFSTIMYFTELHRELLAVTTID